MEPMELPIQLDEHHSSFSFHLTDAIKSPLHTRN